jgi:hypothetical protein
VKKSDAGTFHDAGAIDVSIACYDPGSDKHAQNALIAKVRLGNVCGKRTSSS